MKIMKMRNGKHNDLILIPILLAVIIAMELTMLFYNRLFFLSIFGIFNDVFAFLLLLVLINFIKQPKLKKAVFTFLLLIFALMFIIDSVYSEFFSGFTSVNSLKTFRNLFIKSDLGVRLPQATYIIALESVIGFFFIWFLNVKLTKEKKFYHRNFAVFLSIVITIASVNTAVFSSIKKKTYDDRLEYYSSKTFLYENFYNSFKYTTQFGYLNYRIRDISFNGSNQAVVDDVTEYFSGFSSEYENELTGLMSEDYNLITVLCESLDTRIINEDLMPNFSNVMENSLVFENFYVPTFFEAATINTEFMTLSGMYPVSAKSWVSSLGDYYKNNSFEGYSLPGQLRNNDFDTYYLHLGYKDFYSRANLMPNMGFNHTKFVEDLPYKSEFYDTEMLDLLDFVDFSERFYASMLTYSMHTGNENKFATSDKNNPNYENYQFVTQNYPDIEKSTQVYYTKAMMFDDFIGRFFDKLYDEGALDNTVVMFYPDHYLYGAKEVYNDIDADPSSKEIHHQFMTMYLPEQLKATLLDKIDHHAYNGNENIRATSLLSSTIDITPTLLNLFTPQSDYKYFIGQDIFKGNNHVFFSDYTVFDGEYFLDIDKKVYQLVPSEQFDYDKVLLRLQPELTARIDACIMYTLVLDLDYFAKINNTED